MASVSVQHDNAEARSREAECALRLSVPRQGLSAETICGPCSVHK